MQISPDILKKIIVGSGFVTEAEFEDAAKTASELNKDTTDVLIFRGLINEDTVGKLISEHYGVPFANIRRLNVDPVILELIPEKMARVYRIFPFAKEGNRLKLAMENPEDFEAIEFAKRHTRLTIEPYYAVKEDLYRTLGQYKKGIKTEFEKIIEENLKKAGPEPEKEEDLAKAAEKVPIVKILDTILGYAVTERASDVHIEVQEKEVFVRFRIDGVLRDITKFPRDVEPALVARIKILSNLKIDEHRIPQDGRHKFMNDNQFISLRISIIPGFYGENVVMRLLQETNRPSSMEELGLTGHNLDVIRENITKPHGMILVTGPTGSGKTTTLYSVLNILNTIEVKICTIEDPIEYGVSRVTQIQVNSKTGLEFSAGLRALLRHDPDIIMVGEIRDEETAEIAIHSALTGHLVLSTLHTNTAAGAIPRFLDMGAEDFLLASTLNVIIGQRLVRKICSGCIVKYTPDEAIRKKLAKDLNLNLDTQKFYKGQGCEQCNRKGYVGRIGIYEALPVTEKIRNLITQKSTSDDIQRAAIGEGMITMLQDGLDKVSAGLTTIEEVVRVVREN
jgi:type IV pilus assembly protein PilB